MLLLIETINMDKVVFLKDSFKKIVDSYTVPTFVIDTQHKVVAWNKACEHLTGIKADEMIGESDVWRGFYSAERACLADIVVDNHQEQLTSLYSKHSDSRFGQGLHAENWCENIKGQRRYIIIDAEPLYDESGNTVGAIENCSDVTDIKLSELRGKTYSEVMTLLVNSAPLEDVFNTLIRELERDDPSAFCSILLLDASGRHLMMGAAPRLPDFYNQAIDGVTIGPDVGSCGTAAYTGERVIVEDIQTHPFWKNYKELAAKAELASCWSEPIIGTDGKVLGSFAIYHRQPKAPSTEDFQIIEFVSQLATLAIEQHQARQQQLLASRVFNDVREGIMITDSKANIIDVNPTFCEITGYNREDVIGLKPSALSSHSHSREFYDEMWEKLEYEGYWQGEIWNKKKSGEPYAEILSISALKNETNEATHYVGIFSDITETKKQQEQLHLMAHYDVLTNLPNRILLTDRFNQAVSRSQRSKKQLAICFLDLDNFKPVNDGYGHDAGDQLLVEVANRIKQNIREEDTVSRIGGDEFALLLGDIESLTQCQQTIRRIHQALAEPFLVNAESHKISASIGLTLYPHDKGDIDTLLRHADKAMYQAKLEGKNRYHIFNLEKDQRTIEKHLQLERIEQALNKNEFELYYQPKINMRTGELFGAEALIRWQHPDKGMIPPLEFLPVIEDTELEIKVGNWVIHQAFKQLELWRQQNFILEVSINIASNHLLSEGFFDELKHVMECYPKVDSNYFQLEILESSALSDLTKISSITQQCQADLGVRIALDDFGTGYSSLTHLRTLTANTIKIDQSFVRDLLDDPNDYAIVDGVIGLTDSFGRKVLAEGVETTEHGLMLLVMGCELAQGYGIARPMQADKFLEWNTTYSVNEDWQQCGNSVRSARENKRKLFRLTIEHWLNRFTTNVLSSPEDTKHWPTTELKQSHCGSWIKRAKREQLFSNDFLEQFEQLCLDGYQVAERVYKTYHADNVENARTMLTQLQISFDEIRDAIEVSE